MAVVFCESIGTLHDSHRTPMFPCLADSISLPQLSICLCCGLPTLSQSVRTPILTLEHLDYVSQGLLEAGYDAHAAPVFATATLITEAIVKPPMPDLQSLWHRRCEFWLEGCNQPELAAEHRALAGPLSLNEKTVKAYQEDVVIREAQQKMEKVCTVGLEPNLVDRRGREKQAAPYDTSWPISRLPAAVLVLGFNGGFHFS